MDQIQTNINSANGIIVCGIFVNVDERGRYCLNDLHRASGGANKHKPSLWVSNKQTTDLIAEIEKAGIPAIQSKQGLGTFVSKPLVYQYAMWINPEFNLLVIETFDKVVTKPLALPTNLHEALLLAADLEKKRLEAEDQLLLVAPKAAALDRLSCAGGDLNVTNAAKTLKCRPSVLFDFLSRHRWMYKREGKGPWIGYQDKIQQGLLRHGEHRYTRTSGEQMLTTQVYVTPKGLAKLSELMEKAAQ